MNLSTRNTVLIYILMFLTPNTSFPHSYHLKSIFNKQKNEFSGFLDNVLRQKDASLFYKAAQEIIQQEKPETDAEYYCALLKHRKKLIPRLSQCTQLKLLKFQKQLLAQQTKALIGSQTINGYIEIGTPCTYLAELLKHLNIQGETFVINDQQRVTDYIHAYAFKPFNKFLAYDHFVELNDYAPISEEIESASIDLIVCFIGLHHIPTEKLKPFVTSIARVLKPGGTFLLREHDCCNQDLKSIIYGAHSIYNIVIPGESLQTEKAEYRNFQPLSFWIDLLESHGFQIGNERIKQAGDPSLNTMIKCTKLATSQSEKKELICKELRQDPTYLRNGTQTYLSAPEWFNVDVAQEYGEFINHTPFYAFPYFKSIGSYWHIFAQSIKTAAKKKGLSATLSSPYHLMNLFIGATMTVEYIAKGIISKPISLLYSDEEPLKIKLVIEDDHNKVASIDSRISVLKEFSKSHIKLIEIPRYKELLDLIPKMIKNDINIVEIAGNKNIALKIRYKSVAPDCIASLPEGCTHDYTWNLPTQPEFVYAVITANVCSLKKLIVMMDAHNIELLYIHDF